MRIKSFTVKNYRSITKAYKIPVGDYTILIGPNNEGKSNMLRALIAALSILSNPSKRRLKSSYYRYEADRRDIDFDWDRDFPIKLQDRYPDNGSEITLEFLLNDEELKDFRKRVKTKFSSILKLKLYLGLKNWQFEVLVKGKGKAPLTKKYQEIAEFLSDYIDFQYVPSIRTASLSKEVIEELLEKELRKLEKDEKYLSLLKDLEKLQEPILKKLSTQLTKTVSEFIPDVKSIEIDSSNRMRRAIRRSHNVYVDDGTRTDIHFKGDGIISLTAISLLRHSVESSSSGNNLILAIEEPESHLHPKAIHQLKDVLQEISQKSQVIVTTHSPLLVDKLHIKQNIIVRDSKAESATKMAQIRETIGVKFSDNLQNAYIMLLVEGSSDEIIIKTWLFQKSKILLSAFKDGLISIEDLHGVSGLAYKANMYNSSLCNVIAYLDNDKESKVAVEKAINQKVLSKNDVFYSSLIDMKESEIEDLINVDYYKDFIEEEYGIQLTNKLFNHTKKKWSNRIEKCFQESGRHWDKDVEEEIKMNIAHKIQKDPSNSLNKHRENSIKSLVVKLELMLNNV